MSRRNEPRYQMGMDLEGFEALIRALKAEEDGKELRKELAKDMRDALKPAVQQAKAGIMSMRSSSENTSPALRPAIAKRIRPEVKQSGFFTGVRVKARKTPRVRGFSNAPKRTQKPGGWRHPVFGNRDVWVTQRGKPNWFDDAMRPVAGPAKRAVSAVMESMAARIAARSQRGR